MLVAENCISVKFNNKKRNTNKNLMTSRQPQGQTSKQIILIGWYKKLC